MSALFWEIFEVTAWWKIVKFKYFFNKATYLGRIS